MGKAKQDKKPKKKDKCADCGRDVSQELAYTATKKDGNWGGLVKIGELCLHRLWEKARHNFFLIQSMKQTLKQLMDSHRPRWTVAELVREFKHRGSSITRTSVYMHINGAEPSPANRAMYAAIFNVPESEINWEKNND